MFTILCSTYIYAVETISLQLASNIEICGIDTYTILYTPKAIFSNTDLSIWWTHTHCKHWSNGCVHIITIEIYFKFMATHTKWR